MKALRRSHSSLKASSSSDNSNPSSPPSSSSSSSWAHLRSVLFVVASASPASSFSISSSDRGHLKSPWSLRRRKHAITAQQWRHLFSPDGKFRDGGIMFLKKVRSGVVADPCESHDKAMIQRLEASYDLKSSKEEREIIKNKNRKEYDKLRRQCRQLIKQLNGNKQKEMDQTNSHGDSNSCVIQETDSPGSEALVSAQESLSSNRGSVDSDYSDNDSSTVLGRVSCSRRSIWPSMANTDSSDSDSSEDDEVVQTSAMDIEEENDPYPPSNEEPSPMKKDAGSHASRSEDFASWQRIIRLDAVRANSEWITYNPSQAAVSEDRARRSAEAVGLRDYDHLEPCRIFHAARLVSILEAYALYDTEIGYCQGMSDLLSPIISVVEEDHMAFWCFVGFMKKARHNFRLDEVGIRRQLNIVSKIIKIKDSYLYRHLVKLEAEDCFFVYRMVVVLFRRELSFEQTLCLWEVMWADQAAVRAGIGKSAWNRIRQKAPPTDELLLYAIAASVLQRRKQIIEKYSSMDEILRECNNMAGNIDVWKLLDDAHNLVINLHNKIETSP